MNGPRFLPSCKRLGPYFCSRLEASPASRPFWISVVSRRSTSSTRMACQVIPSAVGLAFALLIGVVRQAGSSLTAMVDLAAEARSPPYCYGENDIVPILIGCGTGYERPAMSIPCKFERSILSFDEHEIIVRSHHPDIYDASLDDLRALRQRLREMRGKERTLAHANRRAVRGKGAQRGASFPGTTDHPLRRKQVFAAALKRVSKEIGRMHKLEARTAHTEAARRALAMRRAAQFPPRPA